MSYSEHGGSRVNRAAVHGLREVIAHQQVTLTALSTTTGIPRSTLTKKLRGQGNLTVTELVRLAIALDVPAADLVAAAVESARVDDSRTQP